MLTPRLRHLDLKLEDFLADDGQPVPLGDDERIVCAETRPEGPVGPVVRIWIADDVDLYN